MHYESIIEFTDKILSYKDPYNHHGVHVAEMSLQIAKKLDMKPEQIQLLDYAARLHDVGKILLDDDLINHSRKLTKQSYARMKTHANLGCEFLSELGCHESICSAVCSHHEHWDGSGYPKGLKEIEIPFFARIITISDVWGSLTNDRAYRKAMPFEVALEEMNRCYAWFDPNLYHVFLSTIRKR